jgi:glycosyltransferase involved in cell wall biosynthesis
VELSVIVPTRNRADLLRRVLESYTRQSLPQSEYELVVVDDGSDDHTLDVCRDFRSNLPLAYVSIAPSGLPAAKNAGIAASSGRLILFADDDDVADGDLLRAHIAAHFEHRAPNIAILGYGTWHPDLAVSPLMHFVTEIGQHLSSYPRLLHGETLDFRYFWGGRVSVKRQLLEHGGFDESFGALEDIELGYRLSQRGLRVLFDKRPVSLMVRPVDYSGFCLRCERLGAALVQLRQLHQMPEIDKYARTILGRHASAIDGGSANREPEELYSALALLGPRVLRLEQRISQERESIIGRRWARRKLYGLYGQAFELATLKGTLGH